MAAVTDASRRFKDAFYTLMVTAINDTSVQIVRGMPGSQQADDIISLMGLTTDLDWATLTPQRTREATFQLAMRVSVWRRGGPEQQAVAEDRAYDLLNAVEEYVRAADTTVGGTVRWCMCTHHDADSSEFTTDTASGRLVEIDAIFTAKQRITS